MERALGGGIHKSACVGLGAKASYLEQFSLKTLSERSLACTMILVLSRASWQSWALVVRGFSFCKRPAPNDAGTTGSPFQLRFQLVFPTRGICTLQSTPQAFVLRSDQIQVLIPVPEEDCTSTRAKSTKSSELIAASVAKKADEDFPPPNTLVSAVCMHPATRPTRNRIRSRPMHPSKCDK